MEPDIPAKKLNAIVFPDEDDASNGFILAMPFTQGIQAQTYLVRSFNNTPYVLKRFNAGEVTSETGVFPLLLPNIAPALIKHTVYPGEGDRLIYELCNGGDLEGFLVKFIKEKQVIPKAVFWELARHTIENLAYIHHGWTPEGPWDAEKKGPWKSIRHDDLHPGNILHWPDDQPDASFP